MRYITPFVVKDLDSKMVFIGGPRQVGKTTLAKFVLQNHFSSGHYFNWDDTEDQKNIRKRRWLSGEKLLVFDELHKLKKWKSWIKGIYDTQKEHHKILVTGSARLDVYQRGGDSLQGRYHYWRLHPFTIDDAPSGHHGETFFSSLLERGGFPEPLLASDILEVQRWRRERYLRIVREDIRDLDKVRDLQTLDLFVDMLKERVGSPVSLSNLASDLDVSPNTTQKWLSVLQQMYVLFAVYPYTYKIARSIKKPPKVYFFDNGDVTNGEGARFENLVATTLLKRVHFLQDALGEKIELYYLRDKEKREVDFAIVKDRRVEELYEVRLRDDKLSSSLRYYSEKLDPKFAFQVVADLSRGYTKGKIQINHPMNIFKQPPWKAALVRMGSSSLCHET